MEKPLAQRAGLGWQGKNSLLINPKFGSWIFLAELITDLELTPDQPMNNKCGDCKLCIDACPTGALSELGQLDASKCLSYLTVEHKGNFPPPILEIIKAHSKTPAQANQTYINPCAVYGCDICQEVCPFNQDTPETKEPQFHPQNKILNLTLDDLASMSQTRFKNVFSDTPLARLSYQQFQRNVDFLKQLHSTHHQA